MSTPFELSKYLGTWYELIHYPSWFQRNDHYNTTAEYTMNPDGTVEVRNYSISHGTEFNSVGTATLLTDNGFWVNFAPKEIASLQQSGEFIHLDHPIDITPHINYVVEKLWTNQFGEYIFAVVTDDKHDSLYLLSRYPHPSLISYNELISYVIDHFDRDRLVQTPHFY